MKLARASCLALLSALLGACSLGAAVCTEDDFLATGFEIIAADNSSYTPAYEGCYSSIGVNDDDLELDQYGLAANTTVNATSASLGPVFYASDNNGGLDEPIWYFAEVEDGSDVQVGDSFLCFDLDLNPAADTHPADVENWGVALDESTSSVAITCEIAITCGCEDDDDVAEESVDAVEDDDESVDDASNSASSLVGSSLFLAVLTVGSFVWGGIMLL